MISERVLNLAPSETLKINEMAKKLKKEGKKVCNLVVGEPQNRLSLTKYSTISTFIDDGFFKYGVTRGELDLRQAVADEANARYGQTITANQVVISNGAKHSLTNVLLTLLNVGDEVILLKPYWVSYPEMVKLAGGVPVMVDMKSDLTPDLDAIKAVVSEKTKAIIVNNPNNPSGAVYPKDAMKAIMELAKEFDFYVISDEIYNELVFEGELGLSLLEDYSIAETPNLIVVNGISKSYGLTGMRIGWVIAGDEVANGMTKIQGQTASCASVLSQKVALAVMSDKEQITAELREEMDENRKIIIDYFEKVELINLAPPKGAFYAFPDIRALTTNDSVFCERLLNEKYVATVPGSAFGMEGYIRMSYSCTKEELLEALKRFDEFIAEF
jgi:aspartate aminotransferase